MWYDQMKVRKVRVHFKEGRLQGQLLMIKNPYFSPQQRPMTKAITQWSLHNLGKKGRRKTFSQ